MSGLVVVTKTDNYIIPISDLNKSLRMNAATAKAFIFPSVGADEDGAQVECIKQGTGRMTLQMVDSDFVDTSAAAGTIYTETLYGTIMLEYVHGMTRWVIITSNGTFITT